MIEIWILIILILFIVIFTVKEILMGRKFSVLEQNTVGMTTHLYQLLENVQKSIVDEVAMIQQSINLEGLMVEITSQFTNLLNSDEFAGRIGDIIIAILNESFATEGSPENEPSEPLTDERKAEIEQAMSQTTTEIFGQQNPAIAFALRRMYGDDYAKILTERPEEVQFIMNLASKSGILGMVQNFGGNNMAMQSQPAKSGSSSKTVVV